MEYRRWWRSFGWRVWWCWAWKSPAAGNMTDVSARNFSFQSIQLDRSDNESDLSFTSRPTFYSVEDKMSRRSESRFISFPQSNLLWLFLFLPMNLQPQMFDRFPHESKLMSNIVSFLFLLLDARKHEIVFCSRFQFRDFMAKSFSFGSFLRETEKSNDDLSCCTIFSGRKCHHQLPTCCQW